MYLVFVFWTLNFTCLKIRQIQMEHLILENVEMRKVENWEFKKWKFDNLNCEHWKSENWKVGNWHFESKGIPLPLNIPTYVSIPPHIPNIQLDIKTSVCGYQLSQLMCLSRACACANKIQRTSKKQADCFYGILKQAQKAWCASTRGYVNPFHSDDSFSHNRWFIFFNQMTYYPKTPRPNFMIGGRIFN